MRKVLLFFACLAVLPAQTVINGGRTVKGPWNASGAASTRPNKEGTALPASCAVGETFFKTNEPAGRNIYGCTAANTWTLQGDGGGGGVTHYTTFQTAICQGATASTGFSTPAAGAPTAACVTGSNTNYGVLQFVDSGTRSIQSHFPLPPNWTGNVDVTFRWRSTATTGNAVWQIQTACVADAETGDPAWNAASTVTDLAKGVANQFNDAAATNITMTGCAAEETLFFRVLRDPAHASDDLNATAELIHVRFTVRRAQ